MIKLSQFYTRTHQQRLRVHACVSYIHYNSPDGASKVASVNMGATGSCGRTSIVSPSQAEGAEASASFRLPC